MKRTFTVRPFDKWIDRCNGTWSSRIFGDIHEDRYRIHFDQAMFLIPTARVGSDDHEPFAEIEVCDINLDDLHHLHVGPVYDEFSAGLELDPDCEVTVFRYDARTILDELKRQGVDVGNVNVVFLKEWSFSVEFSPSGNQNGMGWTDVLPRTK